MAPHSFILSLPALPLVRGGTVRKHRAAAWWWSREQDTPAHPQADVPTVLLVHALTGGARAGGEDGWWGPLIGPGRAFDPQQYRVLCFNNLGSFYGSSAPGSPGFPRSRKVKLTSIDLARAILQGLDALGIRRVHLATGGSLGGMVVLALAALAPERFARIMPLATTGATSAWVAGWNHVARGALRVDPGYPHHAARGLEVARQIAMLTYRAEPGLALKQTALGIGDYLEHHGRKLNGRFTAACYEAQLDAMDHHDLNQPLPGRRRPALAAITAAALVVDVDSDQLFPPAQSTALVRTLRSHGVRVSRATLRSPHGHDAFLLEWKQLKPLIRRALKLPVP
ncbi:MAG: alpha/beta fold hydrolase [Candidatus Didemnitutus sp.]|nr:alpha/beta fold hydrolase [Candidatus Didemnitutus sp.]